MRTRSAVTIKKISPRRPCDDTEKVFNQQPQHNEKGDRGEHVRDPRRDTGSAYGGSPRNGSPRNGPACNGPACNSPACNSPKSHLAPQDGIEAARNTSQSRSCRERQLLELYQSLRPAKLVKISQVRPAALRLFTNTFAVPLIPSRKERSVLGMGRIAS